MRGDPHLLAFLYKILSSNLRIMHDKPGCVQTLPTVSKSSCLGRTNGSTVL